MCIRIPAALHDAQLVKGLYRVQIPRGDVFGIGVGKGDLVLSY